MMIDFDLRHIWFGVFVYFYIQVGFSVYIFMSYD